MSFNFTTDYKFENERVVLTPLKSDDIDYLLPFAIQEPDLWKYSLVNPAGAVGMQQYVDSALNGRATLKEYPFIVFDKKAGEHAGCTRFYDIQLQHQSLQLGYTWYGSKFWGTGLNKHCKYLLLKFAFETMEMQRVEFRADNSNARSIAAMKGIGCTVEGVFRSHTMKADGTRRDSIVLSILKSEWDGGLKQALLSKLI
jgi:RimJ/RimL family protein N-acetyltransferase